ncbi:uncharacterized protein EV154DRAFT_593021 [Mucor mucedo]|uniref:uncharacterized protein n=1 Tax=Mucor mucedo TaxID=29922 RepID=UPI00221F25E4|nr:uncharacterized protein EV154DRAFT_593021 [Mucor mucedo]KAI7888875.1 hypothetical protein EV154DRAFT_593021 [Mucor mucedo]
MLENVFTDELMCDITHRAHLFFVFAWFHASFAFVFLWEKLASFFGSVCAFPSSGGPPLGNPQPVEIGELFVLCNGRITPVSQAKKNSLVASSSSVVSSSSAVASPSVLDSPVAASSPAVACSPAVASSPEAVAFSSVFLSPFALPSVTSEGTKQSFLLRSAPVTCQTSDRQWHSVDFARVAGLACVSGGSLPTIRQPIKEVSSGVTFGFGCEAITKALLATGAVATPAFGGDCSSSLCSPLAVGQDFSPLAVSGAMSGTSALAVSDMDVDDVAVPVSGESGVLGVPVGCPPVSLGPCTSSAPANEVICGVSAPPCGVNLESVAVSSVVVEGGPVGGVCSAGENAGLVAAPVVPVVALPRPVVTPRRLRSGCRQSEMSAVGAVPVAATVADAPLCPPAFSSSLCENQQSRGKRRNDAPPPPSTVRACFVRPLGDRKLSLSGSSDVSSLSVAPVASVGSVSSFPVVASVPSFASFGAVAAVSSAVSVSAVSSVSAVPVVEGPSITVSPVRPMAKPRVAHFEKARERLALKALFDRAEKEEEEEEKKEKEKEEKRSSMFRRK